MPIKVQCSGCSKSFNAKDSLAGKRVKCPACQNVIEIPESNPLADRQSRLDAADQALHDKLLQSLNDNRFDEAASILQGFQLWMIALDEESYEPLIAEVEGMDALITFTSQEFVRSFISKNPEFADSEGIHSFAVEGPNVFAQLHDEIGLLLNPETEHALLLDTDCVQTLQTLFENPTLELPSVQVESPSAEERDAQGDPKAVALRKNVLSELNGMGFYPAEWMPLAELDRELRPRHEIKSRLLALAYVFAWASAPPDKVSAGQLNEFQKRNKLENWNTESEREILELSRPQAVAEFAGTVGWRLENMWPLAWVLGYDRQPDIAASQIEPEIIHSMVFEFIGGFDESAGKAMDTNPVRSSSEVNALEDFFYCAHNAVRSAQFGSSSRPSVPAGFDPIGHGGAVHERRHSLTWCLSPGVYWDDTDLST